jgi:hypothetical protein
MTDSNLDFYTSRGLPEPTKAELDAMEADWTASALETRDETEASWRQQGKVFARVDEPVYITAIDWDLYADVPNPPAPCERVIRLDMIGGGQVKVVEKFVWWDDPITGKPDFEPDGRRRVWTHGDRALHVTAHDGDDIKRARGAFVCCDPQGPCENNCYSVVFPRGTDQTIVDRVATTFKAIGVDNVLDKENFFALLAGGLGCAICGRPLRDEISKLIGVGPTCAEAFNIPHSREAAEKRLVLRRQLLGGAS